MELNRKIFMGVVEDNKDPNRKGRIKVRVQTLYHCIPVEDIPYAAPFAGLAGKRFEIPAIGKIVNVLFLNDDLYSPYYIYSENYNINLQNKLNKLTDNEYIDFIALLFDQKTQIYVKGEELTIDQLLNKITIDNTRINLELKDNNRFVNLGTKDATQEAVLGTNFFEWMDKFIDELSNPASLIGNAGAPILKPLLSLLCMEYKLKRPTFVSEHVKIVDNGKVNILKRTPDTDNRKHDIDLIIPEDECSEFEKVPGAGTIEEQLKKNIQDQNQKACKELKEATATKSVPYVEHPAANSNLELTSGEVLKVWDTGTMNEIKQLHPAMQPIVIKFFNLCEASGYHLTISGGSRDRATQERLKREAKADGQGGFAAAPGNSAHEYGIAIDVRCERAGRVSRKLNRQTSACFDRPNCNEHWKKIGEIGESVGLRWGIDFSSAKEAWHFDMYNFLSDEMQALWTNKSKWPKDSNGWIPLDGAPKYDTNQYNQQNYAQTPDQSNDKPCKNMDKFNQKDPMAATSAEADVPSSQSYSSNKECATKTLMKTIVSHESKDYNTTLDFDKYIPEFVPGTTKKVQPITSLTIGEIKKVQAAMLQHKDNTKNSSAIGKYQFVGNTLKVAQANSKLSDNDLFSPENQDKMAEYLLEYRGLSKWLNNEITDNEFQLGLAQEWASIAVPQDVYNKGTLRRKGQSYYGQNSNSGLAGTTNEDMQEAMRKAKYECTG